jgi:hypothetical protein
VPDCSNDARWVAMKVKEATSNQRGTRVPTVRGGYTSPPRFYIIVKQASSPGAILVIPLSWLPVDKTMAAHSPQARRLQETLRLRSAPLHLEMAPTILRDPALPQSRQPMTSRQII